MGVTGLVSRAVIQDAHVREDLGRLAAVFDECAPAFYRYTVVRVGDPHLAEDLVQGSSTSHAHPLPWQAALSEA